MTCIWLSRPSGHKSPAARNLQRLWVLFALVACAHTFFAGLTGVAVDAGLDLDALQGAAIFFVAMVVAAADPAMDVMVYILLTHGLFTSLKHFAVWQIHFAQ